MIITFLPSRKPINLFISVEIQAFLGGGGGEWDNQKSFTLAKNKNNNKNNE